MRQRVTVVGGGLAGCEATWQLARRGVGVDLVEMRPLRGTEAHQTEMLAELVCSNSFRSAERTTAIGLLKEEMRALDSLVMRIADEHRVPAGGSLAVDREGFARGMTDAVAALPGVEIHRREVTSLPEGLTIIASGPLTSEPLTAALRALFGEEYLYFYDAIAPIVTFESIDMTRAFRASRYGKGGDDYVNCPLDREGYEKLVEDILAAEKVPLKSFERCVHFEGCLPIEEMARRGRDTLAFGRARDQDAPAREQREDHDRDAAANAVCEQRHGISEAATRGEDLPVMADAGEAMQQVTGERRVLAHERHRATRIGEQRARGESRAPAGQRQQVQGEDRRSHPRPEVELRRRPLRAPERDQGAEEVDPRPPSRLHRAPRTRVEFEEVERPTCVAYQVDAGDA